jgi:predicted transcriptional regulator
MQHRERRPGEGAALKSTATTTSLSLPPGVEIPPTSALTEAEAARLTTRIQLRLDTIADNTEQVLSLIEQARNGDAHIALGYKSWTAYVSDKFGGTLARLTKIERIPVVELLAEEGMSTRAIASVVGVSKDTVSRELRAGVSGETPDYGEAEQPEAALTETGSQDDLSGENVISIITNSTISKAPATDITGTDGKTYRKPEPQKLRARPLPDRYWRKAFDVAKATGQLRDLTENRRRYPPNAAAITDQCAGDVLQALADMITVVDRLDPQRIVTSQRRREFLLTQIDRLNDALVSLRNQADGWSA